MRKITFIAAGAAAMVATAAMAAELPRSDYYGNRGSYSAPSHVYNWAGLYGGVNVGYQWGDTTNNPTKPSGLFGGVQMGYNWQSGALVFGGETDLQISGADDTFAPWKFANPWFGTLRGRIGYTFSNVLLYGTLGLAYGGVRGTTAGLDESKVHAGWTAGIGAELAINKTWSAKAEYLYVDLTDRAYSITGVQNGLESNYLRFGVNYHF